jgi:hypothetical protein
MVENNGFISNHQFSFIERHSTVEQPHWIMQGINEALQNKQYCSAAFSGINIWQCVTHQTPVQVKTVSLWIISFYSNPLCIAYTFLWNLNLGTQNSPQSKVVLPRAVSWGHCYTCIHCRPVSLNIIYNCNICQQYCSISHRQWSWQCASQKLHTNLDPIQKWLEMEDKS